MLNWIFLISALNFSFWSEKEGTGERYGVEWQASWTDERKVVYTGYWSLVAALNRGKKILMSPDVCLSDLFGSLEGRRDTDYRSQLLRVGGAMPRFSH